MTRQDEELLKKLLAMFEVEAEEHLGAIATGLLALEQGPAPERRQELVETTFREVHTLKGAARAVNLGAVVDLCHALENVFAILKRGQLAPSAALLDLLHRGFAQIKDLLPGGAQEGSREAAAALIGSLGTAASGIEFAATEIPSALPPAKAAPFQEPAPTPGPTRSGAPRQTVRISTAKLDVLLHQAEELVAAKLAAARQAADLGALTVEFTHRDRIRDRARRLADPAELAELVATDSETHRWLNDRLAQLAGAARDDLRSLGKMIDNLLEGTKQVLMVPFSTVLEPLPSLVRDLSRDQGKEAELVVQGAELEIDRRIQEELKDALLHLIRNAIDHGIEPPAERARRGKSGRGTIAIAISQHGSGKAEIAIGDDGAGIDPASLRRTAQQLGLVSAEQNAAMSDADALSLVFRSGLSTSPLPTDLSGRGLGLAIVQEKVERLGGTVAVECRPGAGTIFRLVLPVTLASFRGVLVEVAGAAFVLPTTHVERVARISVEEIGTVENRETVRFGGRTLGLVWLQDILGLSGPPNGAADHRNIVVLNSAGHSIAFVVDRVRDEREVLMKGLGRQLRSVRHIAGATVLATGSMALILNVRDLMEGAARAPAQARAVVAPPRRKSILIAEDSITARTLFKHVLEAAGYRVKTSVDGLDAWSNLTAEPFDLVVSDIEMPGMGGFDLTAKIRGDRALSGLPVILITSLGSPADRERGVDVGANAYIVKDSFDQSNLLRIVGHLI
ncbi:MAG TPA: response regulator [Aliidongia sp.]|uniref:hybrid sensor histidine kinase/response regulator n=1 Tax=Aliidongia sp. TaxID=1914230 RepID=UPI002DDCB473|nr:response regulator [Aliidongia sp.]HEV2674430.1 response regulator [Aliidongia sp.]